jgi:hypothetical protein
VAYDDPGVIDSGGPIVVHGDPGVIGSAGPIVVHGDPGVIGSAGPIVVHGDPIVIDSAGPIVVHGVVSCLLFCSSSIGCFATLERGVAMAALVKARMRAAAAKRILAVVLR